MSVNMKVLIVGAGASGMMAAITAKRQGNDVVLIEQLKEPGKKIMATGNGKCNFTNRLLSREHYCSIDPNFVDHVFKQFSNQDAIQFFYELGVLSKERNGYYYPNSNQAASIRDALWNECYHLGVEIQLSCQIRSIENVDGRFLIQTGQEQFCGESLIFASGLLAGTNLGSDGSAFQYIEKFGHKLKDVVPGLVQMKSEQSIFKHLAGIRSDVSMELWHKEQLLFQDQGELQLTSYGVSGIVSFQTSLLASKYLHEKKEVELVIDFVPFIAKEQWMDLVKKQFKEKNYLNHKAKLSGFISDKLANAFLLDQGIVPESKKDLSMEQVEELALRIKEFRVFITDTKGFDECQVCLGGVSLEEVDVQSMMSKICPGLFFAGEVLDVAGQCGGYNLQWAWSSGFVAGTYAGKIQPNN